MRRYNDGLRDDNCGGVYYRSHCKDFFMNGFTKEELQILVACVNTVAYKSLRAPFDLEPELCGLRNKIQSMIDNYCEHEFDMTDWVNDSSGCRWYECKKCDGRYR